MSKNYWEVSEIDKGASSKKTEYSFNEPSTKDFKERVRKALEKINEAPEVSEEEMRESWKGKPETTIYLPPPNGHSEEDRLKAKRLIEQNLDGSLTFEQLISEVECLKIKDKQLKDDQNLNNSERQERLKEKENQEKLEVDNSNPQSSEKNNSSDKFPVGWVVGGGILIVTGLTSMFIIRSRKRIKKKLSH